MFHGENTPWLNHVLMFTFCVCFQNKMTGFEGESLLQPYRRYIGECFFAYYVYD